MPAICSFIFPLCQTDHLRKKIRRNREGFASILEIFPSSLFFNKASDLKILKQEYLNIHNTAYIKKNFALSLYSCGYAGSNSVKHHQERTLLSYSSNWSISLTILCVIFPIFFFPFCYSWKFGVLAYLLLSLLLLAPI